MLKFGSLLILTALAASTLALAFPHTQDDFFRETFDNKYFAVVFFDAKRNQFGKKLVDRLLNDLVLADVIKEHDVKLAQADLSEITMLREHYDITGSFAFFFYINNQLQRFDGFSELAEDFLGQKLLYADLLEDTTKFIKGRLGRINAPLRSMEEFQQTLKTHKIIGVYLGKTQGFFFDQFTEFAGRHQAFNFFHAANHFVADQIYQGAVGLPRPQEQDLFAIVRDKSLLDEIDTKQLVSIDAHRLLEDYTTFFEYERFPKLRDLSHGNDIFFRLYNANQKLVVYLYNNETALEELNQFKKAVYLLPRIFMFAHANTQEPGFGSFMQMFIQAGQNPTENKVYIFHGMGGKLYAEVVPASIHAEKIVEAVGRYFQHHRGLFSKGERALVGDSDQESDQDGDQGTPANAEAELVYSEL
jgi:hypothetical protein